MGVSFGEALKRARINKHLSQKQLAQYLYVGRSSVANWEAGRRLPDANMISNLSECLGIDVAALLTSDRESCEKPTVVMVDDSKLILNGGMAVLREVVPTADVVGFTKPSDVIEFAKKQLIHIAFEAADPYSLSRYRAGAYQRTGPEQRAAADQPLYQCHLSYRLFQLRLRRMADRRQRLPAEAHRSRQGSGNAAVPPLPRKRPDCRQVDVKAIL